MMNADTDIKQATWSSGLGLFLAATGAAVGLGNIWKFPYVAGDYGGGAFVLVYLLFVFLIGVPLFMSELMIGRRGQQCPSQSFRNIALQLDLGSYWPALGWTAMLCGFLILSYYSVVAGEVLAYAFRTFGGSFDGQSADGVSSLYQRFRSSPERLMAWHTIFMVVACIIVARGVRHGLEKTVIVVMSLLVMILVLLVINAVRTDSFVNAASFLFDPDFSKLLYVRNELGVYITDADGSPVLTYKGILTAMGHAFFTLGLGVGTMIVFGAYMKPEQSVTHLVFPVVIADTAIALLAGLAIFPIVFSYGLSTAQGPALVFTTLPIAFGNMEYGAVLGGLFYLLLFFAALTSAIALLEPTVCWLVQRFAMTRVKAATGAGIACWTLGLFSVYSVAGVTIGDMIRRVVDLFGSFMLDQHNRFFDLTFFQWLDGIVTQLLLPLTGLLIALFSGWIIRPEHSLVDMNPRHRITFQAWRVLVCYVTPVLVLVVFAFGLFEWVTNYLFPRSLL